MNKRDFLHLSDEELVQHYVKSMNNEAITEIYKRYFSKIFYKCLSYTKNNDDAFDFTHEIIIKTLSNLHSFKGDSMFSTWLYAVTHNYCVTQIEKRAKYHFEDLGTMYDKLNDESLCIVNEDHDKSYQARDNYLDRLLNEISENDRELLILKYRKNYSIKDIQQTYGISGSAVKMRLLRARQKMEEIYNTLSIAG